MVAEERLSSPWPARESSQRGGWERSWSAMARLEPSSPYLTPPWRMPWEPSVWPEPM